MANFRPASGKNPALKGTSKKTSTIMRVLSLTIGLAGIAFIISLSFGYPMQKLQNDISIHASAITRSIAGQFTDGLDPVSANMILKIVETAERDRGLAYGMIMDLTGRVIAHTDATVVDQVLTNPEAMQAVSSNNPLQQVYSEPRTERRIYAFSHPVFRGSTKVGALQLGYAQNAQFLFVSHEAGGIVLTASVLLGFLLIHYAVRRRPSRLGLSAHVEGRHLAGKQDSTEAAGRKGGKRRWSITRKREKQQKQSDSSEDIEVATGILSYEKERIEAAMDSIDDGIIVRDLLGKIIHVNRTMANLMSLSKMDVIGKTIQDCIQNEDIISFVETNQLQGTSFTTKNLEVTLQQFDRTRVVRISYVPLVCPEEHIIGNVIIARDITTGKMSQQSQSDFIAHVAHELRTPLTTINSYVEMLMDDEVSDRETKIDFYNTITDEANRLARLISNLLNISKIETGNLPVQKDIIKTREFFEDLLQTIESQALSKNIRLEAILPHRLAPLVVDKDLLRVSILNILGNAIKYSPSGASITVQVKEENSTITVDITDTGYGIAEKEIRHIFDKFFRSSDEKIKAQPGSGLGLAFSREIIRLHDGDIAVMSTPGQGTRFTLTLPKEDSPRIGTYKKRVTSLMET